MPGEISSNNSLALERMKAEARRRAEEVSEKSAEAAEKNQTRNIPSAGYGGENTVSYVTGDGDVVGATGQVTPILDTPSRSTASGAEVDNIEAVAASSHSDRTAGSLISTSRKLEAFQKHLPPESIEEMQKRMNLSALQLAMARDADPETLKVIDGQIGQLEQVLNGGAIDATQMDSILLGLNTTLSDNKLQLRAEFQDYIHKKMKVLQTLRPLLNHMVDDASNGYMGEEWKGNGLQEMLKQYGIDVQLTPEQLDMFTSMVNEMDKNTGRFTNLNDGQQRELFMQETVALLLGAMDIDLPIDIKSFSKKLINVFKNDFDSAAHTSYRGGYKTSERENRLYDQLLVDEIGDGALLAAQHQRDGVSESAKIPKMI